MYNVHVHVHAYKACTVGIETRRLKLHVILWTIFIVVGGQGTRLR